MRRAVSMGKDQPVWLGGEKVQLSEPESNSESASPSTRRSRSWIWGLAATAAAIGLILFSLTRNQDQIGGQGLIGKVEQPAEFAGSIPGIDTDRGDQQGSQIAQGEADKDNQALEQPRESIGATEAESSQLAVNEPSKVDTPAMESVQPQGNVEPNAKSLAQIRPYC